MNIKKINEELEDYLNEQQLWEMSNIQQNITGLEVIVYVSVKQASHGPRIKFQNNTLDKTKPKELIPMTISDEPKVPVDAEIKLSNDILDNIKKWVILNKEVLLDYWYARIDTREMINSLKEI